MPSVANSPSSDPLTDGIAGMILDNVKYPVGSKITAKLTNGSVMKGEVVAYDPTFRIVIISKLDFALRNAFCVNFFFIQKHQGHVLVTATSPSSIWLTVQTLKLTRKAKTCLANFNP